MKKNEYKKRVFDLLNTHIDHMEFDEKMIFVSNIIIEFEKENENLRDTSNKGKSWHDEELKIILTDAPTKFNCLNMQNFSKEVTGALNKYIDGLQPPPKICQMNAKKMLVSNR